MTKNNLLNKILLIAFIIFVLSVLIFIYFSFLKVRPIQGLKINLIGPEEVLSLENYTYQIKIENNSNQQLKNVALKIDLSNSNGVFNVENIQEKLISLYLGDIDPKQKFEKEIKLFFINEDEENQKELINLSLSYQLKNKQHTFIKEKSVSIWVKNSPIKVQVYLPNKIYLNQQFQANFYLTNLTKQKLENIEVVVETPTDYLLNSAFPSHENLSWLFKSLEPNETKNISIIGQIQDIKSSGIFSVKLKFEFREMKFSLPKEISKINVLKNPVVFYIISRPETKSIKIGSSLFYEITLTNESQIPLKNGEVKITLDNLFDPSSINTDGVFSKDTRSIYWNARNKPELLSINPGDRIKFNFSGSIFESYPILGDNYKNFSTKIRVEFKTPSIPPEVETNAKEYIIFQEDEKKIVGRLDLRQEVSPNSKDDYLALLNHEPATLNWHIYIKTIGEDFKNLTISTRLPFGVDLSNEVSGDAISENLRFNKDTGSFLYTLNNIPANVGYLEKEINLIFKIIVNVPENRNPNDFLIIPRIEYSAESAFTNIQINNSTKEIYTYEIKEP